MTVVAQPGMASPIAVSADLGIRTMTECAVNAGAARLDGSAIAAPPTLGAGLCCFYDGTTDGRFNYSARQGFDAHRIPSDRVPGTSGPLPVHA